MGNKLTKEQVEAKKKHHKKRAKFYDKKLKDIEAKENWIGFKWYD